MEIIDRQQAKEMGLSRYFTGKPCKVGHISERLTNNTRCVECHRLYKRSPETRQKDNERDRNRYRQEWHGIDKNPQAWAKHKIWDLKKRAKKLNVPFTLRTEDLLPLPSHCPVLGIPLETEQGARSDSSISIDRIVNSKGYVKDNIIITSWKANKIKRDTTIADLKTVCEFYSKLEEGNP